MLYFEIYMGKTLPLKHRLLIFLIGGKSLNHYFWSIYD